MDCFRACCPHPACCGTVAFCIGRYVTRGVVQGAPDPVDPIPLVDLTPPAHQLEVGAPTLPMKRAAQGIVTPLGDETRSGSVERSEIEPGRLKDDAPKGLWGFPPKGSPRFKDTP